MDQRGKTPDKKKSRWGHGCVSFVSVVYYQVEVSATGQYLVQRSPTECVCVCVCITDCDKVPQYPSTPTVSREKKVRVRKK